MGCIRVLHIVSSLSKVNGVMSSILNLYREIDRSRIQFDFIVAVNNDMYYKDEIERLGGRVFFLGKPKDIGILSYIHKINYFFREHKEYSILHCHLPPLAALYLCIAKRNKVKYRIVHSHGTMYGDRFVSIIRNFILQIPIKLYANIYFACSKKAAIFLFGKKSTENNKVHIIRNPIDFELYKYNYGSRLKVRNSFGLNDEILIGHVGAFLPVKNHSFIISIFKELTKIQVDKYKLILVGDGPLIDLIKKKVNDCGLDDKVIFTGIRDDVADLLQGMDVLLMPSIKEGLPLVGLESQAAALPSIFSDTVTREVKITDFAFFYSLKKTPMEWAEKINQISQCKRSDISSSLLNTEFDSIKSSENLSNYYLNLTERKGECHE